MWEERTSDVRPPLAHRLQKQLPDYMNEYERPAISVRQRIAAINRTVQEEERKAQYVRHEYWHYLKTDRSNA